MHAMSLQGYPQIDHVMTYIEYCKLAHSEGFTGFTVWCANQITFDFISLLNVFPLFFLLYIEIRIQQQIGWRRPVKFTALTLTIIAQLIVFVHYGLAFPSESGPGFRLMVLMQQFIISMVFITLCYLFCKNTTKILPGRKKWLTLIKAIGVVTVLLNLVIFIFQFQMQSSDWILCRTWFYVAMQSV
jgi:hypothetical protein